MMNNKINIYNNLKAILLIVLITIFTIYGYTTTIMKEDIKIRFEKAYKAWKIRIAKPDLIKSSGPGIFSCKEHKAIIDLGIKAVPFMINKMECKEDAWTPQLWVAVSKITKKKFNKEKKEEIKRSMSKTPYYIHWVKWWKEDRKQTPRQFEKLYQLWKNKKNQKKYKKAKEIYKKITNLGVLALPYMVNKVRQGDSDVIAMISELTDGKMKKNVKISDCINWWKKNKQKWTLPSE